MLVLRPPMVLTPITQKSPSVNATSAFAAPTLPALREAH